jgi:hypothetical protein
LVYFLNNKGNNPNVGRKQNPVDPKHRIEFAQQWFIIRNSQSHFKQSNLNRFKTSQPGKPLKPLTYQLQLNKKIKQI